MSSKREANDHREVDRHRQAHPNSDRRSAPSPSKRSGVVTAGDHFKRPPGLP